MKDEIKEILDSIQEQSDETNWIEFSPEFIQPLLDYITNLQEIEKEHQKINGELRKEITNLQEHYNDNVNRYEELIEKYSNLQEENWQLKERVQIGQNAFLSLNSKIDKAIEYILNLDKDYDINVYQEDKHWAHVLYILQGEDKDE